MSARKIDVDWAKLDQKFSLLDTNTAHDIKVQREAIPLVFVPGIMGSRLRLAGSNGTGDGVDGLSNLRWDPSSLKMLWKYSGQDGAFRKQMLVGPRFNRDYLEVDDADPIGDGFKGLMTDYVSEFLKPLKARIWHPLTKLFEFPVYAFGYNWTDSSGNTGKALAKRIGEIIEEARKVTGQCEKVILITHSMGGIVSRSASELHGVRDSVLGIVHGVQPVTGAAAAYWRIKGGFEAGAVADQIASRILGNQASQVTPVLANIPGGLQLLPTKRYRAGNPATSLPDRPWLHIIDGTESLLALPKGDPYAEIYRVKADVTKPMDGVASNNTYWGLVDPALLNPGSPGSSSTTKPDLLTLQGLEDANAPDAWDEYLDQLAEAERFHDALQLAAHPQTWNIAGTGHSTCDRVVMKVESNWVHSDPYSKRGFRGFFTDAKGEQQQAVLQSPDGMGDGTVPLLSAQALNRPGKSPTDTVITTKHQPAYQEEEIKNYAIRAILTLTKRRYDDRRGVE